MGLPNNLNNLDLEMDNKNPQQPDLYDQRLFFKRFLNKLTTFLDFEVVNMSTNSEIKIFIQNYTNNNNEGLEIYYSYKYNKYIVDIINYHTICYIKSDIYSKLCNNFDVIESNEDSITTIELGSVSDTIQDMVNDFYKLNNMINYIRLAYI